MLTNQRDAFRGQSRSPNIRYYVNYGFYSNFVLKTNRFEIFDLETRFRGHSRSSEPTRIDRSPMISIGTMDLFRTVSETDGDFSRKLPIFPNPVYLRPPPADWVPLGIAYRRNGLKN